MNKNSHIVQDGQFISAEVQRVVMAIKEYEPLIEVQWVPVGARAEGQAAFKIVYHDPRGDFTLFHVKDESEFDMRVLQKIIANDQRNGQQATLSEFEAWEEARKRVEHQEFLDMMEEGNDIAFHVLRTHLNTYKVNDDLVIKDGIPFNAARLKD